MYSLDNDLTQLLAPPFMTAIIRERSGPILRKLSA
jgi:hypothetical protein